jgi:hypothetical protein
MMQSTARVPSEATSDITQMDANHTRTVSPSEIDFLTHGWALLTDFRI